MHSMFDISGKNAIVTGGSKGLGYGVALAYAQAGVNVCIVSRTMDSARLEEIRSYGVRAEFESFDLSDSSGVANLVKKILEKWDRIDFLVNDAGTQRRNDCVDFTDEDWDFVNNVNCKSVFIMCREVGRHMIANGYGKIINFASLLSFQGGFRVPAYAASKGAVMQFTKSLANEWSKLGVNVNCVVPGYFDTDMNTALINDPVRSEQISVRIPAGRWGKPNDIAGAVLFLSAPASDYIDGIALPVDGGWLGR